MKRFLTIIFSISLSFSSIFAEEGEEKIVSEEERLLELKKLEELVTSEEGRLLEIKKMVDEKLIAASEKGQTDNKGFQQTTAHGPEEDDFVDPKVLRDFIESRGLIECRQKSGTLIIAGDVRARWIATGEEAKGLKKRGFGTGTPINVFKSEFNLYMDYSAPKTWLTTKVRYAVIDGTDGGSITKVDLDRAFIGYDVRECGDEDFYIEAGRSKLDYMFESRVQFGSFFDGIHFYYTNKWKDVGIFTAHGGPFVIDSETNHYGFVGEVGVKDLACTGWAARYSLICWRRRAPTYNYGFDVIEVDDGDNEEELLITDNPRYRFLVSQMLISHERKIDFWHCKMLYIYGAVLANHLAKKSRTTDHIYANKAWYIGFTLGKLCKACDWSIDVNYQWVQAQAIPEFDLSGIGHGNADGLFLAGAIFNELDAIDAVGFTNYQGLEVNALYALTDTLSLRAKASYSVPINRGIGGSFFYKNFEMAAIYAF